MSWREGGALDEAERKYKNFVKIVDIPEKSDMIISVIITNINKDK